MAIYHFSAKIISRANGSSALASSAYRSASRLYDERLGRHHDFSNKTGVVHSEVLLPEGAPDAWRDRAALWNAVEAAELRKDAQLSREVEFAIPRELDQVEGIRLAREFVEREFVARGMVADLNVHWDIGADGEPKPHAHVMLTTREVRDGAFSAKVRDWNRTDLLEKWRERWAEHVNLALAELDIDARIDHRSLEAQGIELEPQHKIGPAASRMAAQGLEVERVAEYRDIARANGEKLLANPTLAIDTITHSQATFTTRDLAKFVHRHSNGKEQFDRVMAAVRGSPELVKLGKDGRGEQRFTSRDMLGTELRLEQETDRIAGRIEHSLPAAASERVMANAARRGLHLGPGQESALRHVVQGRDLGIVIGYAGTGKSTTLGLAREAWEQAGYRIHGAALSGIAAENLENGSGIGSRTLASLERQWAQDRDLLTNRDVLVLDEAGMIGTRQMERIVREAEKRGAKLVLIGDPEQLQAIEAGAAFRSVTERYGHVEITDIRRQREGWQRDTTRQLATGRTAEAIHAYAERGAVHAAETREAARAELVERWNRDRVAAPDTSRMILAHTNDDVRSLNELARGQLRAAGDLGTEVDVETARGQRAFAAGDRVMFLRNERGLGVKNGSLGRVDSITAARMAVMLDDGRAVAFDIKDYADIDHGYAATVHKAQGMTVDRVHVLATPGLDRHAAYVALSRHRDAVDVHYGRDDFADQGKLVRALSRERGKDMASDYQQALEPAHVPSPPRNPFAGLKLGRAPAPEPRATSLDKAVERYARAAADILRMRTRSMEALPHQRTTFAQAGRELDAIRPDAARDLRSAFNADHGLIDQAANGRTAAAIRAMALEAELRIDGARRADQFVAAWQQNVRRLHAHERSGDYDAGDRVRSNLTDMAKSLHRDPQLESLLRNRVKDLGIGKVSGSSISHELLNSPGLSRGRGLSR
ncbi:Ti-type conjugative transfer relaxase TraA [Sphingomonas koreensis]|uniref:Ti-type conjugative transfer relaxase TraA n=1 Tax=Sphingomonas koreensis TaxID=93064 RepID=A0A430G4D6_9SPHN|nr:Ti-type conjugative transfer relaxase TraA [Sphingomonas koreensis]RSY85980.1 Ti-type conjugative transfer relaxase TraA [Sphingomonas koreensis]